MRREQICGQWLSSKSGLFSRILHLRSCQSFLRQDVFKRMKQLGLDHSVDSVQNSNLMASGKLYELSEATVCAIKIYSFSWKFKFLVSDQSPVPCILESDFVIHKDDVRFWKQLLQF
jgi:hypothetical protein